MKLINKVMNYVNAIALAESKLAVLSLEITERVF